MSELPKLSKEVVGLTLGFAAVAVGGAVITAYALPKIMERVKQPEEEKDRMQLVDGMMVDRDNGNIYSYIIGKGGEQRFVRLDRNSENKVRREREKDEEKKAKEKKRQEEEALAAIEGASKAALRELRRASKKKQDVRSEKIFEKNSNFKEFNVNSKIKYRLREKKMLYRIAIALKPVKDKETKLTCLNAVQNENMISLIANKSNEARFRFEDKDNFWIKDSIIPLDKDRANNKETTVIDSSNVDECGNITQLVFHGRLDGFTLPDYSWVEDGNLLFKGVKLADKEVIKAKE